ncbi:MAG TPA: phage virion morphogenesis protein [Azospirillaceae bacterium]|nr:phage virion morphogenesis protein [Azospirillaceae bacterium]
MTGASLTIALDVQPMARLFARLAAAGVDLAEPLADIAGHLERATQRRFETGRDPAGAAWKPSARAAKTGGKTLVWRGHLRDSITSESDGMTARVGTNVDYAAIHQFGGRIEKKARIQTLYVNKARAEAGDWRFVRSAKSDFAYDVKVKAHAVTMPARPFLGLGPDDHPAIADILMDHLRLAAGALA